MRMKRVEIAWLNHLNMVEHHDCVLHVVASDAHGLLHFPSNSVCVKCNNHNPTESGKWCWNAPQRPHPCNWDVQIDIRNFNQRQFQHITFDCCTSVCFFLKILSENIMVMSWNPDQVCRHITRNVSLSQHHCCSHCYCRL